MLSRRFVLSGQPHVAARWFTRSSVTRESSQPQKSDRQIRDDVLGAQMYRVTNFDKRMLVWVKRYPNIAAVPQQISTDTILKARNHARIKTTNYMIVFTIIGCVIAGILGKRRAEKGENLRKLNEDWYREKLEEDKK